MPKKKKGKAGRSNKSSTKKKSQADSTKKQKVEKNPISIDSQPRGNDPKKYISGSDLAPNSGLSRQDIFEITSPEVQCNSSICQPIQWKSGPSLNKDTKERESYNTCYICGGDIKQDGGTAETGWRTSGMIQLVKEFIEQFPGVEDDLKSKLVQIDQQQPVVGQLKTLFNKDYEKGGLRKQELNDTICEIIKGKKIYVGKDPNKKLSYFLPENFTIGKAPKSKKVKMFPATPAGKQCEHVLTASVIAILCGLCNKAYWEQLTKFFNANNKFPEDKKERFYKYREALLGVKECGKDKEKYTGVWKDYAKNGKDYPPSVYQWAHPACNFWKNEYPYLKIDFKLSGPEVETPTKEDLFAAFTTPADKSISDGDYNILWTLARLRDGGKDKRIMSEEWGKEFKDLKATFGDLKGICDRAEIVKRQVIKPIHTVLKTYSDDLALFSSIGLICLLEIVKQQILSKIKDPAKRGVLLRLTSFIKSKKDAAEKRIANAQIGGRYKKKNTRRKKKQTRRKRKQTRRKRKQTRRKRKQTRRKKVSVDKINNEYDMRPQIFKIMDEEGNIVKTQTIDTYKILLKQIYGTLQEGSKFDPSTNLKNIITEQDSENNQMGGAERGRKRPLTPDTVPAPDLTMLSDVASIVQDVENEASDAHIRVALSMVEMKNDDGVNKRRRVAEEEENFHEDCENIRKEMVLDRLFKSNLINHKEHDRLRSKLLLSIIKYHINLFDGFSDDIVVVQ